MARETGDWLPEDLGGRLRAVRQRAALTQRDLALASGIPRSTIGRIESGSAPDPRIRTLCRLFAAAGCHITVLDPRLTGSPAIPADRDRPTATAADRGRPETTAPKRQRPERQRPETAATDRERPKAAAPQRDPPKTTAPQRDHPKAAVVGRERAEDEWFPGRSGRDGPAMVTDGRHRTTPVTSGARPPVAPARTVLAMSAWAPERRAKRPRAGRSSPE